MNTEHKETTVGASSSSDLLGGIETRVFNDITFYSLTDKQIELLHKDAKKKAWDSRQLDLCKCDSHVEYCEHCFPPSFRAGGKWAI